jgi:outer membrane protein
MKKAFFSIILTGATIATFAQQNDKANNEKIQAIVAKYNAAEQQLTALTLQWQQEIMAKDKEAKTLTAALDKDAPKLTPEQKTQRQNEIDQKRIEVMTLQEQHFGRYGDLYKKDKELIMPVREELSAAMKNLGNTAK